MTTKKYGAQQFASTAAAGLSLAGAGLMLATQQRRSKALRMQEKRLEQERQAQRRVALAHQQRMHWELLIKAIDDPSLAAVIDTYDKDIPAEKRRQFLYANAWYVNAFHLHRAGLVDVEELFGHLRELFQNPVMREYWNASQAQRDTLKHSSDEARIGRIVNGLIQDLEEADTEEWWVVGEPPTP
ncbi:DUF6082 family protein [Streptomyces sp. NPDC002795]|uniref:DUF6082 family protein n=1 Tax=Streptomyces sp. NPDC002795 TaxID=3364665 RepID=UPI003696C5C2